jgi:hypothetical protein
MRSVVLRRARALCAGLLCTAAALAAPTEARAEDERADLAFALLRYPGGNWNPRPKGLPRLAWEARKRTSIAIALETAAVDPTTDQMFEHPLVVWQGDTDFPALPVEAVTRLRQFVTMGGTLLIDISDGREGGSFHRAVLRELGRIFPDQPLRRVSPDHVLYKAFYLLDRHGGRVQTRAYLEGLFVEDRLAVILSTNDLAGAVARDEFGEWVYDVGPGGETTREMTFRLGINVLMYALCLNYKEDQVHIPFILKRRQ